MNSLKEQYDQLSKVFSQSRKKHLWPDLLFFLNRLKPGDSVLDMGSGSGRLYRGLPPGVAYVGVDISPGMLEEAKKEHPDALFIEADILNADSLRPLGQFDFIYIVAVVHHLDELEIKQLFNCAKKSLKPQGTIILSCWRLFGSKYISYHLKQIKNKILKANWRFVEIPFFISSGEKTIRTINRTCYAYNLSKLKALASSAGLRTITESKNPLNLWLEFDILSGMNAGRFLTLRSECHLRLQA